MNLGFFQKLCACPAPLGGERDLRDLLADYIAGHVDEVQSDVVGNLIARKQGDGPSLMLTASLSQRTFLAEEQRGDGKTRLVPIGGVSDPKKLDGLPLLMAGGGEAVIQTDEKGIFIKEEGVPPGARFVVRPSFTEGADTFSGGGLSERVGAFLLAECIRRADFGGGNMSFAFTVGDQPDYRGARTASWRIAPLSAIWLGAVGLSCQNPDVVATSVEEKKGPAIKLRERFMTVDRRLRDFVEEIAVQAEIPFQYEILAVGGTSLTGIQYAREGVVTGGISTPVANIGAGNECIHKGDLESAAKLAILVCNSSPSWANALTGF